MRSNPLLLSSNLRDSLSLGMLYIGVLCSMGVWAVSSREVWRYYTTYRRDPTLLRILVFALWILDTLHQGLNAHIVYSLATIDFGLPNVAELRPWSLVASAPAEGLLAFSVQAYFVIKIWRLTEGRYLLSTLVATAACATFAVIIADTTIAASLTTFTDTFGSEKRHILEPLACALAALTDVLLTGSMAMLLARGRSGSADPDLNANELGDCIRLDDVIMKLVIWATRTGLLTTICALSILMVYYIAPFRLTWMAFFFVIGRLYFNSFMISLNLRQCMRRTMCTPAANLLPAKVEVAIYFY